MVSLLVQLMAYLSQFVFVWLETLLCHCCFMKLAVDMVLPAVHLEQRSLDEHSDG